jgi:hypothetical protein
VPALLTYKKVYGDLEVPYIFEVPPSEPWPEHLWGVELGATVSRIRSSENYGWMPHNASFIFSDMPRPALGVFASLDRF